MALKTGRYCDIKKHISSIQDIKLDARLSNPSPEKEPMTFLCDLASLPHHDTQDL